VADQVRARLAEQADQLGHVTGESRGRVLPPVAWRVGAAVSAHVGRDDAMVLSERLQLWAPAQ